MDTLKNILNALKNVLEFLDTKRKNIMEFLDTLKKYFGIFSGQVQLIGGNSRMDQDSPTDQDYSSQNVAIKAQVIDKYAFNAHPHHESIKDLLHLQSQQNQRKTPASGNPHQKLGLRPNEEWSPAPKEKVWYQINRPSFKRRKRRRRR